MKIFIVHATAGSGHTKAAEALFKYFKEHCPQEDLRLVDCLAFSGWMFRVSYRWGYSFLVRRAIKLWEIAFRVTDLKQLSFITRPTALANNLSNTVGFTKFLLKEKPDLVISTHFLPSEIIAFLKRQGLIKTRLATVITDFGVHRFWISEKADLYIVACSKTKELLVKSGVSEDSVLDLGIPVDEKYTRPHDRAALCAKLNIDINKFTVLVMTGSFGIGPLEQIATMLHHDVQVLVVCARNKKLFKRIRRRRLSNVKAFGFVDNADELMAVSDLIITKPGGLSISEVLNMELAPVFISAIPGQEEQNVKILKEYGVGEVPKNLNQLKDLVLEYKNNAQKLSAVKVKIRLLKKLDTAKDICNAVCKNSCRPAC